MKLPYIKAFKDRHGRARYYFRRRGFKTVPLPPPISPGFMSNSGINCMHSCHRKFDSGTMWGSGINVTGRQPIITPTWKRQLKTWAALTDIGCRKEYSNRIFCNMTIVQTKNGNIDYKLDRDLVLTSNGNGYFRASFFTSKKGKEFIVATGPFEMSRGDKLIIRILEKVRR